MYHNQIKPIIASSLLIIALTLMISVIILINRSGKYKISIAYSPREAQVLIDNNIYNKNNKTFYIDEGEHTLSIYLDGYLYQENIINVNKYTLSFAGQLTPINIVSLSSNNEHISSDEKELEAQKETLEKLQIDYPIIQYLPYSSPDNSYNLNYEFNNNFSELRVTINLYNQNDLIALNSACEVLKSFSKDNPLGKYNIEINNYNNIFSNFQDNNESSPLEYIKTGFSSNKGIEIQNGKLIGNYFYTAIGVPIGNSEKKGNNYILYKVILKKSDKKWELVDTPYPILTVYNTPDTPINVINSANSYNGNN